MPLPPEIDNKIRKRFGDLMEKADRLVDLSIKILRTNNVERTLESTNYASEFVSLKTSFISLIQLLSSKNGLVSDRILEIQNLTDQHPEKLRGMIAGLKSDYRNGMLDSLADMVEANITVNYLEQAEQLLTANLSRKDRYITAAVLAGIVLENSLRILCDHQNPPIPTKIDKKPKTLATLIDALKGVEVFNETKAKQLRYWAGIRNDAVHGEFGELKQEEVEQMIKGIKDFLADYLGTQS
jgi:uncharacterized protein YutE (UPF0331/DUF86 family)